MANNPYNSKVQLGDGTVLMDLTADTVTAARMLAGTTAHDASGAAVTGTIQDMAGTTVTPSRNTQTISTSGKRMTGDITVAPIPDTYYTQEEALEMMFPVGSIYISTSATAPTFGGTWEEILVKQTLAQVKSGERDYFTGTNTGNIHYWKRLT